METQPILKYGLWNFPEVREENLNSHQVVSTALHDKVEEVGSDLLKSSLVKSASSISTSQLKPVVEANTPTLFSSRQLILLGLLQREHSILKGNPFNKIISKREEEGFMEIEEVYALSLDKDNQRDGQEEEEENEEESNEQTLFFKKITK